MKHSTKQIESSGKLVDYLVVDQLPTNFRSYDVKEVYVRGLLFKESLSLSQYIGSNKPDYQQLSLIYSDAIQGIEISKLEIIDFIMLMIISSIYTKKDFSWIPNIRCSNIIEGARCEGTINEKITIDDFDFSENILTAKSIPLTVDGTELSIGPVSVLDYINREKFIASNPEYSTKQMSTLLDYCVSIKNDMDFVSKIEFIMNSPSSEIEHIASIANDYHVKIAPIPKTCPECGAINHIKLSLTNIRGFP